MSRSVDRALSILGLFDSNKLEWGISEISRELALPKSTVHGLVKALEKREFLQVTQSGKYALGIQVYELGRTYTGNIKLNTAAEPMIKYLSHKYQESVHIAIYAGRKAVFIMNDKAGSEHSLFPRVGADVFAHCTAVGKVLLAWQLSEHIEKYLATEKLIPLTAKTITDRKTLQMELERIRGEGYAVDNEEALVGTACIAAPIFNYSQQIIAAVSVSGNAEKMLDNKVFPICRDDVMEAARKISEAMGYDG